MGETIIATDMWRSTAGFLAGLFMQGAFVFISVVMLSGNRFSKATAYTGILSNGLDFAHVLVGLFIPSVASIYYQLVVSFILFGSPYWAAT